MTDADAVNAVIQEVHDLAVRSGYHDRHEQNSFMIGALASQIVWMRERGATA